MNEQETARKMHEIKRVLITGIAGSGGSYLAEYIVQNHPEVEVHGLHRWHSTTTVDNLKAVQDQVALYECDLMDLTSIVSALRKSSPDAIFHLAAHANVRASFDTPLSVLHNNVIGTGNLLEAVRMCGIEPIIQMCSTSEVYGKVRPEDVPIHENVAMRPANPYAASKCAQDVLGYAYFESYGLKVVTTRAFTYFNPRRHDLFSTRFARQVARIEAGLQTELTHGNLDSVRTMVDVRDMVDAYWKVVLHCEPGQSYNIGGDTKISVGEFLEKLIGLAECEVKIRQDPKLLRPSDVTLQIPDSRKFRKATGWKPVYSFEESIRHLLEHCRQQVALEKDAVSRS